MAHIVATFEISERRACGPLGIAVSSFRYRSVRNDDDLRDRLVELARDKPRYGYRRLHVLPGREVVNHKRVWSVYREAGLSVKRRKRKRLLVDAFSRQFVALEADTSWGIRRNVNAIPG